MTWRAKAAEGRREKPWVRSISRSREKIDRLRLSSNREYFYDTDYLDKKPYLPKCTNIDIDVLDGRLASGSRGSDTWYVNKKLNEKHPERAGTLEADSKAR